MRRLFLISQRIGDLPGTATIDAPILPTDTIADAIPPATVMILSMMLPTASRVCSDLYRYLCYAHYTHRYSNDSRISGADLLDFPDFDTYAELGSMNTKLRLECLSTTIYVSVQAPLIRKKIPQKPENSRGLSCMQRLQNCI